MNDLAAAFRTTHPINRGAAAEEASLDENQSHDPRLTPLDAALPDKPPHNFIEVRQETLEEYRAHAKIFRHNHSGAQVLALRNDNPNITFALSLATLPDSDEAVRLDAAARILNWDGANDGKPHCGEHWVLRGSKQFPSHEPILQYGKASVASESNASTSTCSTCFYVTTNNLSDLKNHIALILDAVFHPLLEDESFAQDIWRIEKVGSSARLRTNGAALNEERTGYADPIETHTRRVYRHLLPDTPFAFDSGGDPAEIITLAPEKLREYVRSRYHPSNTVCLITGNINPEEVLPLLESEFAAWAPAEYPKPVIFQRPFEQPKRVTEYYPGGKTEDASRDSIISVNFCLGEPKTTREELELMILEEILLAFDNSPLAEALNDSELGEAVLEDALLDDAPYALMSFGMSGCALASVDQIEALVLSTLNKLASDKISKRLVQKAVDSVEFGMRELSNSASPGDAIMEMSLEPWSLGRDPIDSLRYIEGFRSIREDLKVGVPVFESLITEKLLSNNHRLTLILRPQRKLNELREERELKVVNELLQQGHRVWSEEDNQARVQAGDKGIRSLPRMKITDLEPRARLELPSDKYSSEQIFAYPRQTNGVVSMELALSLAPVSQELLQYLCLWLDASRELRTTLDQKGFGGEYSAGVCAWHRFDAPQTEARVIVSFNGLAKRVPDMLSVMEDVLSNADLDKKSLFIRVALRRMAELENALAENTLSFAESHAQAKIDLPSWIMEQCEGVTYIQFLRQFVKDARRNWSATHEKIERARSQLLSNPAPLLRFTGEERVISANLSATQETIAKITRGTEISLPYVLPTINSHHGIIIPSQVSSVIQGVPLASAGFAHHGSIYPIVNHLHVVYLWQLLRLWGGAYEPYIAYCDKSGILSLGSGQGLNILEPLDAFREIPAWLRSGVLQEEELRRSKIGAIGALDSPESIHDLCHDDFILRLCKAPENYLQRERSQLLDTGANHVEEFIFRFEQALANHTAPVTAIGAEKALNEVKNLRGETWMEIVVLE